MKRLRVFGPRRVVPVLCNLAAEPPKLGDAVDVVPLREQDDFEPDLTRTLDGLAEHQLRRPCDAVKQLRGAVA